MKITRITRQQVYEKLDSPFNAPLAVDDEAKDAFFEEWYGVRRQLLLLLERFGKNDEYDGEDFNLGDTAMLSRGIGVTFTGKKMLKPAVIEAIVTFLQSLNIDYEVNVTIQEDGVGQHDLFISKTELLSQLPDKLHKQLIPSKWL